jgi:hypothetical protein
MVGLILSQHIHSIPTGQLGARTDRYAIGHRKQKPVGVMSVDTDGIID